MAIRKYYNTQVQSVGPITQNDGTVASGTAAEINIFTIDGIPWEQQNIGTQTLVAPVFTTGANPGLDISADDTASEGTILTPFSNSKRSRLAFTINSDPAFFVRAKFNVATVANVGHLMLGFKATASGTNPMQAHTATWADYTDKACIGLVGADVTITTCLNNAAGDTSTDTTDNAADATDITLTVKVSSAGVVTYLNGTSAPTVTAAFTFDPGDIAVPFIWFDHAGGGAAGAVILREFTCGIQ